MPLLEIINAGFIGFALSVSVFTIFYASMREEKTLLFQFSALSLLVAFFSAINMLRRGCTDPYTGLILTQWQTICVYFMFALLPFIYRNLSRQRAEKKELAIVAIYTILVLAELIKPASTRWTDITAMVPRNFGNLGTFYEPEGHYSPFRPYIMAVNGFIMCYCFLIAWKERRHIPGSPAIVLALPLTAVSGALYFFGNDVGWWRLPLYGDLFTPPLYLTVGSILYFRERRLALESRRAELQLRAANQQLEAGEQQVRAANQQLRASEQAIRESEARFKTLSSITTEGIMIHDKGIIVDANQAFCDLIGAPDPMEIIGRSGMEIIPFTDESRKRVQEHMRSGTTEGYEIELVAGNGALLPTETSGNTITYLGRLLRIVRMRDITEIKSAQQKAREQQVQLIQADKMASLGVMVSGIAHEINNPNNYISLSTPLLRSAWDVVAPVIQEMPDRFSGLAVGSIPLPEFIKEIGTLIEGIEEGSKKIKNIVSDLKNYSRQEFLVMQKVDINEMVKASTAILNPFIKKQTRRFSIIYAPAPVFIEGNFQRLEQVVINLIQNSCDALSDPDQSVEIRCEVRPEHAAVVISDTGCGIPPENLTKIIDPFFTTKRATGGTGLGLSVSMGIIKEHHAEMQFESEPGKGTTVTLLFPRK